MWVDVLEFEKLGKEKSFLNKDQECVRSLLVRLAWQDADGIRHELIALCGTTVCDKLRLAGSARPARARLRFAISPSRSNPNYKFTSCYVEDVTPGCRF